MYLNKKALKILEEFTVLELLISSGIAGTLGYNAADSYINDLTNIDSDNLSSFQQFAAENPGLFKTGATVASTLAPGALLFGLDAAGRWWENRKEQKEQEKQKDIYTNYT